MQNKKRKTALLITGLNIVITIVKYIMFGLTGSLAILAEAWHSFSDIATSFLVYISIKFSGKPKENKYFIISYEEIVSFIIGFVLLIVSINIFAKVYSVREVIVQNSTVSGIVFLVFSIMSYAVYKIENSVAQESKSISLMSDSLHSKSDFITSLFTGISLLLYTFGLNVDRFVAILISLLIFSFAIEIMFNLIMCIFKKDKKIDYDFKTTKIAALFFDKDFFNKIINFIRTKTNLHKSPIVKFIFSTYALIIIALVLYISTTFYKIDYFQEGIIERNGKIINKTDPVQPGLHFKLPYPFDKIIKIDSKKIHTSRLGIVKLAENTPLLWTIDHGLEVPFITGDNNYLFPYLSFDYRITDIFKYYLNSYNSNELIEIYFEKNLNRYLITNEFWNIVTTGRKEIKKHLKNSLSKFSNELGIEILNVNINDMHPPIGIAGAFESVVASYQEKQREKNDAISYQRTQIPQQQVRARQNILNAYSYNSEKIMISEGEAERFKSILEPYKKNTDIIKKYLYFKNFSEALQPELNRVVIDKNVETPDLFVNPGQMLRMY